MEQWDVLDAEGNPVGRLHMRGVPMKAGDYHLVVDIWIRDDAGRYLIARRAPHKKPDAGCWAMTCGCAIAGDDSLSAALREVREELGLSLDPKAGRMFRRWMDAERRQIVDVWYFRQNVRLEDVVLQIEETDQAAWADRAEILKMIADGRFVSMDRVPYAEELLS